jgi:NADH-quinone oxidoreductase subunit N
MIIYAIISIGTFGFVSLIKNKDGSEDEKMFDISSLSGLSKTNPIMAFSLTILMFSTAGIPPLAGFFSKFYILISAISHGLSSTNHEIFYVAIIAIIFSVISAFYYIRIVKIIYFDEPKDLIELEDYGNCKLIILTMAIINLVFIIFINSIINLINSFII